jgi:predicted RNase H-like nuclease (RuvC/YqgF family)
MLKNFLGDNNNLYQERFDAVDQTLVPLEKHWEEAVEAAIEHAQYGRFKQAGEALVEHLLAWGEGIKQEGKEKADKYWDQYHQADEEKRRREKELVEVKKTCEQLQKDKRELEWEVQTLHDKLKSQGKIMAELHYKLKSIFGEGETSAQT